MDETLAARVMAGIAAIKRVPVETISVDSTFEQLAMDSLDAMNLLFSLEEELGVSIPDDAALAMKDVRSAVAGVERVLAQNSGVQS